MAGCNFHLEEGYEEEDAEEENSAKEQDKEEEEKEKEEEEEEEEEEKEEEEEEEDGQGEVESETEGTEDGCEVVRVEKVVLAHELYTPSTSCICSACRWRACNKCLTNSMYPGQAPVRKADEIAETVMRVTGVGPWLRLVLCPVTLAGKSRGQSCSARRISA